ncbi:YidH family protein [Tunturiibacter psychrotolerans]|uniref:YidH family protein n=1 Tax=Tunturiibacter psychrotolerans TaxID=3069686 RepID=UPI003D1C1AB3
MSANDPKQRLTQHQQITTTRPQPTTKKPQLATLRRLPYNPTMPTPPQPAEQDPRVYFAAERTFLAWIRTGLGLMGIGFAVSRFGLFLRQISAVESHLPARTTGLSLWSGVLLVALGVIVNLSAVYRHVQLIQELSSGTWRPGRVSRDAVVLGLLLAAAGVAMAIYLMLVR